jgi:hypothetical protein
VAVSLRLDWCSHEAAKYAVEHWHYSRSMPAGKLARIGVWEDEQYVGCVLFGRGAAIHIASPFGLDQTQVCELVRVALQDHRTPVSRILAIAVRMLKRAQAGLRLIVSFADSEQGHHGGIYQANGWVYLGSRRGRAYCLHGQMYHPKTLHSRYGYGGQSVAWLRANVDPNAEQVMMADKHKYVMPLDAEMRAKILPLAKPYPKRATSIDSDASTDHVEERGAMPTVALPILTAGA